MNTIDYVVAIDTHCFGGYPRRHFEAIGQFIAYCSHLDVSANLALRSIIKLPDEQARALLDKPRLKELIETFRYYVNLIDAPESFVREAKHLCEQMGYVNSIRQIVAHKPFGWTEQGFGFHDAFTSRNPKMVFIYDCTIVQLRNCCRFIDTISKRLLWLRDPTIGTWPPPCLAQEIEQTSREKLDLPDTPNQQRRVACEPLPPQPGASQQ